MMLFYIFAFLSLFAFLARKNLVWAIALIAAFLPAYLIRFKIGPLPMTLLESMILILFAVWLVNTAPFTDRTSCQEAEPVRKRCEIKEKNKKLGGFKYLIALWLLVATISALLSPNLPVAMGLWKAYFIEPILFFIVFINVVPNSFRNLKQKKILNQVQNDNINDHNNNNDVILSGAPHLSSFLKRIFVFLNFLFLKSKINTGQTKNPEVGAKNAGSFANTQDDKGINLIFSALGFSALYLSLFAIWQKIAGLGVMSLESWQGEKILRVTSFFPYPNALGLFLAPVILLLIPHFFMPEENAKRSAIKKLFYWLAIFSSLLAIIFAKSEGALLGLAAGLIFFGLMTRITRKLTSIGLIIFAIILFSVAPLKNYFWQKTTLSDFSGEIRKEMWSETYQMLKQKPLLGAGLANYQNSVAPFHKKSYIEIYLYPHNIFLNFWSELGLFGLIVFLGIMIKFFWLGFKNKNDLINVALMSAMLAIIIHGLVDVPYFKNDLAVLFWLIIGLMEINFDK